METPLTDTPEIQRTIVEIKNNGPIVIHGPLEVRDATGEIIALRDTRVTSFCACGKSSNLPFCDGTHKPKVID